MFWILYSQWHRWTLSLGILDLTPKMYSLQSSDPKRWSRIKEGVYTGIWEVMCSRTCPLAQFNDLCRSIQVWIWGKCHCVILTSEVSVVLAEAVVGPVSPSHDSVSPSAQPTSVLSLPGQFLTECYLMIPSQRLLPKLPGLGSIPLGQVAFPAPKLPSYFVLCTHLNTVSGLIQVLCFAHFPNT